jgi:hypothetical protein
MHMGIYKAGGGELVPRFDDFIDVPLEALAHVNDPVAFVHHDAVADELMLAVGMTHNPACVDSGTHVQNLEKRSAVNSERWKAWVP